MYETIRMPLACMVILAYSFWFYRIKKHLRTRSSELFVIMAVISMIHLAAAIITEYTVNNRDIVSERFNYIWHVIFLVSITCICGLIYCYLIFYVERGTGRKMGKDKAVLAIVCSVGIVLQIVLPIEYVDTVHGSYSLGPKAYALYGVVIYVMVMMVVQIIRYRDVIDKDKTRVFISSVAVFVVCAGIQIIFPYMLLTGLAVTLIMLGIMGNTEDAHRYISHKTEFYNELGCKEILQEILFRGKPFRIGLYVFFGSDEEAKSAMVSVEKQLNEKKDEIMCGTPADHVLVILPVAGLSRMAEIPRELPVPDIGGAGIKYNSAVLEFGAQETLQEVLDVIAGNRSRWEEEAFQCDELTGLLRRTAFMRQVDSLVLRKQPFSFVMVDVDDFKRVNDTYGHSVGDEVLRHIAETFRAVLRNSDIICRMGGDEFAIVLYGVDEEEETQEITGRIREALAQSPVLPENSWDIHLSMGVQIYHAGDGDPSFQELYVEADTALYDAKNQGKNKTVVSSKG